MNEIVVTKTEHITHDLFLLMLNLSQVKNAQRMRELFMESMDYLFAGLHFSYVNDKPDRGGKAILISTLHNRFGYILIEGDLSGITADIVALISNAISMLAVVL